MSKNNVYQAPASAVRSLSPEEFDQYQLARSRNTPAQKQEARLRRRAVLIQSRYGIPAPIYLGQLQAQQFRCLGCRAHEKELGIALCADRDPDTRDLRGLFCHSCKRVLDTLRKRPGAARNLAIYIDHYQKI